LKISVDSELAVWNLLNESSALAAKLNAVSAKFYEGRLGDVLLIIYTPNLLKVSAFAPVYQYAVPFIPTRTDIPEPKPYLVWMSEDTMTMDAICNPVFES
jgi:hypothetical protein